MNVYVITHLPTTRHYVGKANRPERRWLAHLRAARKGVTSSPKLYRALREYPVHEFKFQVIERFETEEAAYEAECFWIGYLNSTSDDYGFNTNPGGLWSPVPLRPAPEDSIWYSTRNSARKRKQIAVTFSDECREHLRIMAGLGGMSAFVDQLIKKEWERRHAK